MCWITEREYMFQDLSNNLNSSFLARFILPRSLLYLKLSTSTVIRVCSVQLQQGSCDTSPFSSVHCLRNIWLHVVSLLHPMMSKVYKLDWNDFPPPLDCRLWWEGCLLFHKSWWRETKAKEIWSFHQKSFQLTERFLLPVKSPFWRLNKTYVWILDLIAALLCLVYSFPPSPPDINRQKD